MSAHSLLGYRGRIHVDRHSPAVGTLPAYSVLPKRNDAPVIMNDVVVVFSIWGQRLGETFFLVFAFVGRSNLKLTTAHTLNVWGSFNT